MTTRIRILPYGPSDSCVLLRDAIREYVSTNNVDANVFNLNSSGSAFRTRQSDVIINYGNRRYPESFFGQATVLNNLRALNQAANKLTALNTMSAAGISVINYTSDYAVATSWLSNSVVYARATLTGHSGEGITVHLPGSTTDVMPSGLPLYTQGIQGPRREWRVHIFNGVITYVQKKIRRNGYREDPNYREDVRNHHTGWVYSNQFNDAPNDEVLRNAVKAVESLGLDFGAVDVISKGTDAWVLEVNTAPGLTGTTLDTYMHNIVEYVKSLSGHTPDYRVAYQVPDDLPVEDGSEEAEAEEPDVAADENFALDTAATPSNQEVVPEQMQMETLTVTPPAGRTRPRGYYLADILHPYTENVISQNVVLFCSGTNLYRSGWNVQLDESLVRNVRRIDGFQVGNTVVTQA